MFEDIVLKGVGASFLLQKQVLGKLMFASVAKLTQIMGKVLLLLFERLELGVCNLQCEHDIAHVGSTH